MERKKSDSGRTGEKKHPQESENGVLDTLFWGPEIVVEAARYEPDEELFNRSGFVASIDLSKTRERIEDAALILARTVGVTVKQYGGLGNFATVSIRGSSSNHVQVYMDGVPMNDACTGITNLADLALEDIHRIEIFRGFSPTAFGASAIGGTINLVTRGSEDLKADGPIPRIESRVSTGSLGTHRYLLTLTSRISRLKLHCHGGYMSSDGDFSFFDDNATPENPLDDSESERRNNDFSRWNLTGRISLDLPWFKTASINYDALEREGGIPGTGANQTTTARFERDRRTTYIKLKPKAVLSKRIHTDLTAFYSWIAERFRDPGGDINLARQETDNRIKVYGGNIRSKIYSPVVPVSIELFFEGKKERFHPVSHLPVTTVGPDRLRETHTLSVSGDLSLFSGKLILTAGSRTEWNENEFYDEPFMPWLPPTPQGKIRSREQTPNLGFRLRAASFLTFKGNWGRYYRQPAFFELFGNRGTVTGKSDLENEKGLNRDIGVIVTARRALFLRQPFLELVYIDNEVENLILFFPNSQSTVKPKNIGSAAIRGCEISFSASIQRSVSISGNYAYLDGKDTGPIPYYNGNRLPGRPVHQTALQLEYARDRWSIIYGLHYIGSNYLDRYNREEVSNRKLHSLSLTLRYPGKGISLGIEGHNLGNDMVSDVSGFPLPGRIFFTTLRLDI